MSFLNVNVCVGRVKIFWTIGELQWYSIYCCAVCITFSFSVLLLFCPCHIFSNCEKGHDKTCPQWLTASSHLIKQRSWFRSQGDQVITYSSSFLSSLLKLCKFALFSRWQLWVRVGSLMFAPVSTLSQFSSSQESLSLDCCCVCLRDKRLHVVHLPSTLPGFPLSCHEEMFRYMPVFWPHHFIHVSVQNFGFLHVHCWMNQHAIYCSKSWSLGDESWLCWFPLWVFIQHLQCTIESGLHHLRAKRTCRSLVFFQNNWIPICWKGIMEFFAQWCQKCTAYPSFKCNLHTEWKFHLRNQHTNLTKWLTT